MPLTVKDNSLGSGVFCGHLTLTPICLWEPALDLAFHPSGVTLKKWLNLRRYFHFIPIFKKSINFTNH
jgi:hypothetical protein